MDASACKPQSRIQRANRETILAAALDTFAEGGFHAARLEAIAERAGMSKQNLLYYFGTKAAIHAAVLEQLLDTWLDPLRALDPMGDPLEEVLGYLRRKLQLARDLPAASRLFANEILAGAPNIETVLAGPLRAIVDDKAALLARWMDEGRLARRDPHHLIFSIWAVTQHYADFDVQVRAVLGGDCKSRFARAEETLTALFRGGLRP